MSYSIVVVWLRSLKVCELAGPVKNVMSSFYDKRAIKHANGRKVMKKPVNAEVGENSKRKDIDPPEG